MAQTALALVVTNQERRLRGQSIQSPNALARSWRASGGWTFIRLDLDTEDLFGILLLHNSARCAHQRLAIDLPERYHAKEADEDVEEVLSVATTSLFDSDYSL